MASLVIISGGGGILSFVAFTSSSTNATSYTFSGVSIGTVDATRRVMLVVGGSLAGTNQTVSSITIGGVTATIHIQTTATSTVSGICSALSSTSTTATIVVTFSTISGNGSLGVYHLINGQSSPYATMGDKTLTTGLLSGSIDIPGGGIVLAGAHYFGATPGNTWTGATEDYDQEPDATFEATASHTNSLSTQTGRTISVANTTTTPVNGALVAVSWF